MVDHLNSIQLISVCLDYVKENLEALCDSIMQVFKLSPLQAGLEFSIHKQAWVAESAGLEHKLRSRTDKQCRHSQRKGWLILEMRTASAGVLGLTVCCTLLLTGACSLCQCK